MMTGLVLTLGLLWADVFTVRDDGTGDFDDILVAVETVPAGSTLLLRGSFFPDRAVVIDKPLDLIGEGEGRSRISLASAADLEVMRIDTDVNVTLRNLWITTYHYDLKAGHDGILVDEIGALWIDNCVVESWYTEYVPYDQYWTDDYWRNVPPAALRVVGTAEDILVTRSDFIGADAMEQQSWTEDPSVYDPEALGLPGGWGIDLGAAEVVLIRDSRVSGGDGGEVLWNPWPYDGDCDNSPCATEVRGGDGGHALVGSAQLSGVSLQAGTGAESEFTFCDPCVELERGSDGEETRGDFIDLSDQLGIEGVVLGADLTLLGQGYSPFAPVLLFVGGTGNPVLTGGGYWWLWSPHFLTAVVCDQNGDFSLTAAVRDDIQLLALPVAFQAISPAGVSNPDFVIIGR